MEMTLKAAETAKRNLVQRIERLMDAMEKEGRAPIAHESLCIRKAIKALKAGAYRQGEDDVLFAERPDLYANTLVVPPDNKVLSLIELREQLRKVLAVP